MKKLLIVESPTKAKKLKEYLDSTWEIKASMGHICDLPSKELGVDKSNGFKPTYVISDDKRDTVKNLKSLINSIGKENVFLATDPDREGEAISFHLCRNLDLDYKITHRVTFQEITPKALKEAILNPRKIDIPLVSSQEARRVIDRLFGFEISDVVRRKVKSESILSAGRVQSVALKLIVEREREIEKFGSTSTFKISGFFLTPESNKLKANASFDFKDPQGAREYLESTASKKFSIKSINKEPKKTLPQPPFSTSTLQQDANRKLKFSVEKTMQVAQKLFENGHITYMRTDSVNLSEEAVQKLADFIKESYGIDYLEIRKFKNKSESSQEAHEAIRPSVFTNKSIEGSEDEKALYNLIYLRAVASQMKSKETAVTTITIDSSQGNDEFKAKASIVTFDGFTKAYSEQEEEDSEEEDIEIKEQLKENDPLSVVSFTGKQTYTKPKSRFGQADLVQELEAKEIGRPSTVATIIRNLKDIRNYVYEGKVEGKKMEALTITFESGKFSEQKSTVTLGAAKDKLIPNEIAFTLVDFLQDGFNMMMDYEFTAKCEKNFDNIAHSKDKYVNVVSSIYSELSKAITHTDTKHPDIEGKARKTTDLGHFENEVVSVGKGEHGVYVKHKEAYFSIKDKEDSSTVTLEHAIKAITDKRKSEKEKKDQLKSNTLKTFGSYKIIQGEKGPYIMKGTESEKAYVPKWDLDKLDSYDEEKCKAVYKKFKDYLKSQATKK